MSVSIRLRYGKGELKAQLSAGKLLGELNPREIPEVVNLKHEIVYRLKNPVGTLPLASLLKSVSKIVIVTGDHTRVLPTERIIPVVIEHLMQSGVDYKDLTVVIGVGNHRPVTEEEKRKILGPVYGKVTCLHSREAGYTLLGMTKRGTPVEVSTPVAEADFVIALGNIEFHQLTGFSGGVKGVAAGTASRRALEHNHRLGTLQSNGLGMLEGNIVRQDMEEFARTANLRFIINTVINEQHQVVYLTAGDPVKAHRAGCTVAQKLFAVKLNEPADIAIVSPGGSPKDDTVYQAQKSIKNALKAVKSGGIIIITAKCSEGFGDPIFEQWMSEASSPHEIMERSKKEFVLGGHKCLSIASAVMKARVFMVSDMKPEQVRKLFLEPFGSLQEAIDNAIAIKGEQAGVLIMPWGGLTVPL